jgi:hypothetical protein
MSTGPMATSVSAGTSVPVPPSHHGYNLNRWPLRDAITLGALDGAVPSARAHVHQLLWEWNYAELAQDASVVVSELVTNADAPRGALLYPRCSRAELKGGSWA